MASAATRRRRVPTAGLSPRSTNSTSRVLEAFQAVAARGELRSFFDPDFRMSEHRPAGPGTTRGHGDLLVLLDELGADPQTLLVPNLLAVRGDRCGLVNMVYTGAGDATTSLLIVAECGQDGRITDIALYHQADLRDAVDHMVKSYTKHLSPVQLATLGPTAGARNAFTRRDLALADHFLTDDFEHSDFRADPTLTVSRSEALDFFEAVLGDDDDDVVDLVTEIHLITPRGVVASRTQLSVDAPVIEETEVILATVRGSQVDRLDFYNDADLGVALARLEELSEQGANGSQR